MDSIFAQKIKPLQVIAVNDASTDNTLEVLESYSESLTILSHKGNRGLSATRNTGLAHVNSEYVAFTDADVLLDEKWASVLSKYFIKPGVSLAGGSLKELYVGTSADRWRMLHMPQDNGPHFAEYCS